MELEIFKDKYPELNKKLPLRAYPEKEYNFMIYEAFLPWLSNLLSLTGESSAERLKTALPSIKDHCLGMGFDEIRKMFELYADGKLNLEPIPNYFDRMQLGKIVNAYRSQKKPKKMENGWYTQSEIDQLNESAVERVEKEYNETGAIKKNEHHVYDFLDESGRINFSKEDKWRAFEQAKTDRLTELELAQPLNIGEKRQIKSEIDKIQNNKCGTTKALAKTILLKKYFERKKLGL